MSNAFSLILPCFNEEGNIETTVRDCTAWLRARFPHSELIVVDDGSKDATGRILDQLRAEIPMLTVVTHQANKGYGAAIVTGCDSATGDVIGFMDSDGQFKAEDFDLLLPHLTTHACVVGRRSRRADPPLRLLNALLYRMLALLVLGIHVRDINCGMKLYRSGIWPRIRPTHATGALFNGELFLNLQREGISWKQIEVHHYPRLHGHPTGANLHVILKMFRELAALKKDHAKRH